VLLTNTPLRRRHFVRFALALSISACSADQQPDDMTAVQAAPIIPNPPSLDLATGDSLQFTATADIPNTAWSVLSAADAVADGATIDSTGTLRTGHAGRYLVLASQGARQATAYVRVTDGAVRTAPATVSLSLERAMRNLTLAASDFWIQVTPDTVTVAPGDTLQLAALGYSADGGKWTIRAVWQASAGSVSAAGSYVAPDTAGQYRVVVTRYGDVQADTATVRVASPVDSTQAVPTSAATGVSASCSNEPADYRRVATAAWGALPPRQPLVSTEGFTYFLDQIPTLSIVQDTSAPTSAPSVLRVLFPQGFRGGESPSRWGTSSLGPNGGNLYVCMWVRFDPWWSTEGITIDKFFYVHQNESRLNHAMVALGEYNQLFFHALLQFPDDWKNYNIGQVRSPENTISGGGWHKLEMVWEANTPGQRNGGYRQWVDDHLIASATDAYWFESGNTPHWDTVWFDPVYGRTDTYIPRDQSWYMDATVISVK